MRTEYDFSPLSAVDQAREPPEALKSRQIGTADAIPNARRIHKDQAEHRAA